MDLPPTARINPPLKKALALAAAVFLLLLSRALTRPLDLDEHQFVAPAILLDRFSLQPYLDYPLFHTPALVWIYAALIYPFSNPLLILRIFSALVGTTSVMLVFWAAFRRQTLAENTRRWGVALAITILYLGARALTYVNGWAWNHDASILAALAAVLLQLHAMRMARLWPFLFVGLLMGLSFTIRLTTLPILGALAIAALFVPSALSLARRAAGFVLAALGTALAVLPTFLLYRAAPDAFRFGNFTYPQLYRLYLQDIQSTHHTTFFGKIGHFFQFWGGDIPGNLSILLLLILALFRIIRCSYWRGKAGTEIATLLLVLVAAWFGLSAPFQMQQQYHAVLLPFFLLLIIAVVDVERFAPSAEKRWLICLTVAAVVVFCVQFPRWYWYVVKLPVASAWTPVEVEKTGDVLHKLVPAGARILTLDPIVALEAGYEIYPQFATGRFIEHVGRRTTQEDRQQFGMWYGDELTDELAAHPPGAIVYNLGLESSPGHAGDADDFVAYAISHHFVRHTISAKAGVDYSLKPGEHYPEQTYAVWLPTESPSSNTPPSQTRPATTHP